MTRSRIRKFYMNSHQIIGACLQTIKNLFGYLQPLIEIGTFMEATHWMLNILVVLLRTNYIYDILHSFSKFVNFFGKI